MKNVLLQIGFFGILFFPVIMMALIDQAQNLSSEILVKKCKNFKITGDGSSPEWANANWIDLLPRKNNQRNLRTQVKVLYSDSGLYFLFHCHDEKLTATMDSDFLDLWNEDVVEVFLWPEEQFPIYFEYELSPMNYELPLLVPNLKGRLRGWLPWHYEGDRRVRHATSVQGSEKKSGAPITAWTAEFFIPYELLKPLGNIPPRSGTRWRANLYRCDYDSGMMEYWSWQLVEKRFHEFEKFGTFIFE